MLYLVAVLAIGGQLGASFGNHYTVTEDQVFVLKSVVEIPEGYTVVSTFWLLPETLDYHQRSEEVFGTGKPGKYKARQLVTAAKIVEKDGKPHLESKQYNEVYTITIEEVRARPPPKPDDPVTTKANKITYVYEREEGTVPREVAAKFRALNAAGEIEATTVDRDVVDGTGQIPDQYKLAFAAAAEHGTPCFVVESQGKVLRVVKTLAEALK